MKMETVAVVVAEREYRRYLTGDFIRQCFDWWAGIANRWYDTRSHYIVCLVTERHPANAELIVRILESMPHDDRIQWGNMEATVGPAGASVGG